MTVQELLALAKVTLYTDLDLEMKELTPRIICMDGTSLSVQAGENMYSSPRLNQGPYYSVEVGYPSRRLEGLMPYIDGDKDTDPTDTVYGYVPIDLVEDIVTSCGGICVELTLLAKRKEFV